MLHPLHYHVPSTNSNLEKSKYHYFLIIIARTIFIMFFGMDWEWDWENKNSTEFLFYLIDYFNRILILPYRPFQQNSYSTL